MSILSSSASFPHWRPAVLALLALACLCFGSPIFAQEAKAPATSSGAIVEDPAPGEHAPEAGAGHEEKEGLPAASPVIGHIGPLPINSSMIFMWTVAIILIAFAQYATRNIKQVPDGAQNFWELLVEGLRNFLENIIGRVLVKKTFPFFASVFIFILAMNWFGLIPGIGTIGWGHVAHGEFHVDQPLFRGANADLNMTLAMSMIFFVLWTIWAIQSNGFGGFFLHLFGPKGDTKGLVRVAMIFVFAVVGVLEVVSILFRPVSLSFRLYGNIFAGENILESMSSIVPGLAWLIPIPFYFMELLVGIVQALVFMLLTAVFTLLICSHGEEPHAEEHDHKHH